MYRSAFGGLTQPSQNEGRWAEMDGRRVARTAAVARAVPVLLPARARFREGARLRRPAAPARVVSNDRHETTSFEVEELTTRVRTSLRTLLSRREEMFVRMRFGIGRSRARTQRELGERFRIPLSGLAFVEARALRRLRQACQ